MIAPLAVKMRPNTLEGFVGQKHLLGEGRLLRRAILSKRIPPLIFWGPAGCGKTTLGFIIANYLNAEFKYLNAAFTSLKEVKEILEQARREFSNTHKQLILFIDEIHRFNKLQQEAFLPDTEHGTIVFIGATIYNPYYYIIPSLISRAIVAHFRSLSKEEIITILKRALRDKERGLGNLNIKITNKALDYLATLSGGDARKALSSLEIGALTTPPDREGRIVLNLEVAKELIQKSIFYDKRDSYHYDTISAFIKSVRGSDVDASLYWLAKMIKAGEDPRFIARRLVILASEDIGNANPFALVLATSCFKAVEFVGMPEASLILAQTTIYLASSPKSNASYKAIERVMEDVEKEETKEVPSHLKTHSSHYKYPHDFGGYITQSYGVSKKYYYPLSVGEEKKIKEFLDNLKLPNRQP
ncbi:MAG TPA: replication-associated recombination protein A [Candidatus Omnitrophica bacterium]|nr:replication-associated recombination protein A [Candidatus Omnitrophota bacterium]